MGLSNEAVREHMDALFGSVRAAALREQLETLSSNDRESLIVEELAHALRDMGGNFVLPFTFKNECGSRTTHHLFFVTKHFRGYEVMKEIMAQESSERLQGVASFEYSLVAERFPMLFELTRPLDDLEAMLLDSFAGQRLSMRSIYEHHSVGRPYIKSNYKKILAAMESTHKIETTPPAEQRRKRKGEVTFADEVIVTFPAKEKKANERAVSNRVDGRHVESSQRMHKG
jgi:hypothetical protein